MTKGLTPPPRVDLDVEFARMDARRKRFRTMDVGLIGAGTATAPPPPPPPPPPNNFTFSPGGGAQFTFRRTGSGTIAFGFSATAVYGGGGAWSWSFSPGNTGSAGSLSFDQSGNATLTFQANMGQGDYAFGLGVSFGGRSGNAGYELSVTS